jgi:hypothetical protein
MRLLPKILAILAVLAALQVFAQMTSQSPPLPVHPTPTPAAVPKAAKTASARDDYAGDAACGSCHQATVDTFHQTAHSLTSSLPNKSSILGKFTPGANVLTTSNPDLHFQMSEKQDEFFQAAVQGVPPYTTERTERIGLVIGSGGKGQTYLFWKGDQLFQLPVSYWAEIGWVNSPGYRDGVANFARPIIPRCLECHATYFESVPPPPNRYSKAGYVVGITCEKCHGPGREHILRESSKASVASDSAILSPAKFSRDRQMDLCAWCHAGHGVALAEVFSYLPGQPLADYVKFPEPDPNAEVDVHGSQVELLEKSRCFQASALTCLTCHDVHMAQHDPAVFSRHCLSCHKPETAMFPKQGHPVESNCIDCHMPMQDTNLIVFDWNGRKVRPKVRNHWIKIYPASKPS